MVEDEQGGMCLVRVSRRVLFSQADGQPIRYLDDAAKKTLNDGSRGDENDVSGDVFYCKCFW